jgi:hypothetical protein
MKLDQISTNGYAVTDVFDDATLAELKDKCKTANARGDVTADTKALTDAIAAFLKVWVH